MPTKSQRPKFSGALNEPIVRTDRLVLGLQVYGKPESEREEIFKAEADRIAREKGEKLLLLFEHYGIPKAAACLPVAYIYLAFHLALDCVPGMRVVEGPRRKRGAPGRWKGVDGAILILDVKEIIAERQNGIADAIRILLLRKPELAKEFDAPTLETRYYEALKEPTVKDWLNKSRAP